MQIVIDIPDRLKEVADEFLKINNAGLEELTYFRMNGRLALFCISKGTPLPEHHGRLGDLDALEEYFRNVRKELKASDYKNGIEFFVRDEMLLNVQQFIHLCDAIIEGSDSE